MDGFEYSGRVEGHPIESGAAMSGYNHWPSGFLILHEMACSSVAFMAARTSGWSHGTPMV
ncbi:hypothetical protein [Paenibacillus sp. y28]|uniref:hypothetical protein n=1 Tax=Paenibacillus sp. y28 TaxID=3129110 RepID=UPI0030198DA1